MTTSALRLYLVRCHIAVVAALAWSVAAPSASAVDGVSLGEAPLRYESQETSGWLGPQGRPAPQATGSASAAETGLTRATVVDLYRNRYLPGNSVALLWSGAIASCDPGFTNDAHRQAVIDRVNYARTLAGLPEVVLIGNPPTFQAQAASLMMSANNALSHSPPAGWRCYSADGAAGAGSSNLALGAFGVAAVDLYLDDPGSGNAAVGHRRWLLFPPRAAMATGDVPRGGTANPASNDLYVFGPTATRPATPSGIAWPPAGFVPYQNLPAASNRWSLSYPGADFSAASVTMTGPAGAIPVALEAIATGYGDNTIVFLPGGISYGRPDADTSYLVTVGGIRGTAVPATIAYTVTVMDPDVAAPPTEPNFGGLWWNAPANSESGWGLNLAHQGDVIFATWYTYDIGGKAWWLSMTAIKTAEGVYSGTLYVTSGPSFDANPFDPDRVARAPVGTGTLAFTSARSGSFAYTVNGISRTKAIVPQEFGALPTCIWGAQPDPAIATNYQDLWWAAPAGSESGWGVNLAHQGDTIFATWYTYGFDGSPLWLSATAPRTANGSYAGTVYLTTGPAFDAERFDPNMVARTPVGSLAIAFDNGNAGNFAYTVGLPGYPAITRTKPITRQIFRPPGTVCR